MPATVASPPHWERTGMTKLSASIRFGSALLAIAAATPALAQPDQTGVFVDNSFRPNNRLTLDVGVRYDRHPTVDRLSPRASLIWTPAGSTTS